MITNYTISRIPKSKNVDKDIYIVRAGDKIVKECGSYLEAQNFIFTAQTEELMYGEIREAS